MILSMQRARTATAPTAQQGCNTSATQALHSGNESATQAGAVPSLAPKLPPGRRSRKGLAFGAEIVRLRGQGYTLEAIRQALLEVGVSVCRSTILREAARHTGAPQAAALAAPPSLRGGAEVSPPVLLPGRPPATAAAAPSSIERRSGKAIAESFMRGRITNPLFRNKS